jgi:hypothetical protein
MLMEVGNTTPAFSNGIRRVSLVVACTDAHGTNEWEEYLRGNSSEDECAPLFKKYKSCLTVHNINLSIEVEPNN